MQSWSPSHASSSSGRHAYWFLLAVRPCLQVPMLSVKSCCWRLMQKGVRIEKQQHDGVLFLSIPVARSPQPLRVAAHVAPASSACAGVKGFMVNRTRGAHITAAQEPPEIDEPLKKNMFYWDAVHPGGRAPAAMHKVIVATEALVMVVCIRPIAHQLYVLLTQNSPASQCPP